MFAQAKDSLLETLRDVTFARVTKVHKTSKDGDAVFGHAVIVRTTAGNRAGVKGKHVFFHKASKADAGWKFGPIEFHTLYEVVEGSMLAASGLEFAKKRGRPNLKNWVQCDGLLLFRDLLKKYRAQVIPKSERRRVLEPFRSETVTKNMRFNDDDGLYLLARIVLAHDLKLNDLPSRLMLEHTLHNFVFYLSAFTGVTDLYKAFNHIHGPNDEADVYSEDKLLEFTKNTLGHMLDYETRKTPPQVRNREMLETVGVLCGMTRRWVPSTGGVVVFPIAAAEPFKNYDKKINLSACVAIPNMPMQASTQIIFCSTYSDGERFVASMNQRGVIQKCSSHEYVFEPCETRGHVNPHLGTMLVVQAIQKSVSSVEIVIVDILALGGYLLDTHNLIQRISFAKRLLDCGVFKAPCAERVRVTQIKTRGISCPDPGWTVVSKRSLPTRDGPPRLYAPRNNWIIRAKWASNAWHLERDERSQKTSPLNSIIRNIDDDEVYPPLSGGIYAFELVPKGDTYQAKVLNRVYSAELADSVKFVSAIIKIK